MEERLKMDYEDYVGPKVSCEDVEKEIIEKNVLWILEVEFFDREEGKDVKGIAVVKAHNAKEAIDTYTNSCMYNGQARLIKVTRCEEIVPSPDSMLICEQYLVKED